MQQRFHVIAEGLVQGVGYRWFIAQAAKRFGLKGFVRNLSDGTVEMDIQGEADRFDAFFAEAKKGPFGAQVLKIRRLQKPATNEFTGFEIRRS
ncbi:acylphosphatase [Chloroherpeton thalassium ATCC 35110]|uniref:acylphosphatase n=1 Tax=Chloroherpeton thalassium (strain ATCC 35110 / GB-78) TaxID=517418 RepID=B3QZD3_CHLT3|nr:acylphosphatase [Chloroherpeton thalassium]ACF13826.1 acylphosphatase [Chloroherpeton thalassium ATCC 35110]